MPKTAEPWSLKLIKICAKVSHGRDVAFSRYRGRYSPTC